MFHLNKSAANRVKSYFSTPKSVYEKYINKKWDERKNNFISKQRFIETAISEWKISTDVERIEFLSKKAPERKEKTIKDFFKKKNSNASNVKGNEQVVNDDKSASTSISSPPLPTALISNAVNAADHDTLGRESYLAAKEKTLITSLLESFSPADNSTVFFAASDIANDKTFISSLTALAYRWSEFDSLKMLYEKGKSFLKKSQLKTELENINFMLNDFNTKLTYALSQKCSNTMDSFAMSQTYLKRAELIKYFKTLFL